MRIVYWLTIFLSAIFVIFDGDLMFIVPICLCGYALVMDYRSKG